MTKNTATPPHVDEWATGSSTYQLFILGLSIGAVLGWVAIFLLPLVFPISEDTINIMLAADSVAGLIFLYDFFRRLFAVPNKKDYLNSYLYLYPRLNVGAF